MNSSTEVVLPRLQISVANTFTQRAVGLLGRRMLPQDEGLYFPNTSSVHTFGMLFAIDLAYLDADHVIVAIHRSVKPFRISWCSRAQSVCELAQGAATRFCLHEGQKWPSDISTIYLPRRHQC
jgi:uncharacterized protein